MTGHSTDCPGVFLSRKANVHCLWCSHPSSCFLHQLTDETDVTDPGQMAYQAGNPWLRPKPVWGRRSLRMAQALPGRQQRKYNSK